MAKSKLITHAYDRETGILTFNVEGVEGFTIDTRATSDNIREAAMVHGFVQKISDAAAMPKSELPKDAKKAATVKRDAMLVVRDRLVAGDWKRPAGEGGGAVSGLIFRAYAEFATATAIAKKKPVPSDEKLREVYGAMDRAKKLSLRNVPEIAEIIERIKSERGDVTAVDTDALLGDLGI